MIKPKDPNLYQKIENLISSAERHWQPWHQQRVGKYLINVEGVVAGCLVFDDNENIIDGFTMYKTKSDVYDDLYKQKTFYEWLQ